MADKNVKLKDGNDSLYPLTKIDNIIGFDSYHDNTKQNTLVSGTNIKTINGNSILTSGNINVANKQTTYSNITVSVTPTAVSSYNQWDTEQVYGYEAYVTINGLTSNSMIENIIMSDTLFNVVAPICKTMSNALFFYTKDATALSGMIFTLITREVS